MCKPRSFSRVSPDTIGCVWTGNCDWNTLRGNGEFTVFKLIFFCRILLWKGMDRRQGDYEENFAISRRQRGLHAPGIPTHWTVTESYFGCHVIVTQFFWGGVLRDEFRDATASRTRWLIMDWDKNAVVCAGKVKLRSPTRSKKTRLRNALYQCDSSAFLSQK